jgi:internalin A
MNILDLPDDILQLIVDEIDSMKTINIIIKVFGDKNILYNISCKCYNKRNRELTYYLNNCKIQYLYYSGLQDWNLTRSQISYNDFNQLKNQKYLHTLHIECSSINNDLRLLTQLRNLSLLKVCNSHDFSFLESLTKLQKLNITNVFFKDHENDYIKNYLYNLTNLTKLTISGNNTSNNLHNLPYLPKLKTLNISHTTVDKNISCIELQTNITSLNISSIISYKPPTYLTKPNFECLTKLINLRKLTCINNYISENIKYISQLTNLQKLDICYNSLSFETEEENMINLAQLTNLQTLYIDDNSLTNIHSLSTLTNLSILSLCNNLTNNINSIYYDLSNNIPIDDINKLKKLLPNCKID